MVRKFATGDPGLRYLGKAIEESLSIRVAIDLLSAATGEVERLGENLGAMGEPVVRDFIIACACSVRSPSQAVRLPPAPRRVRHGQPGSTATWWCGRLRWSVGGKRGPREVH